MKQALRCFLALASCSYASFLSASDGATASGSLPNHSLGSVRTTAGGTTPPSRPMLAAAGAAVRDTACINGAPETPPPLLRREDYQAVAAAAVSAALQQQPVQGCDGGVMTIHVHLHVTETVKHRQDKSKRVCCIDGTKALSVLILCCSVSVAALNSANLIP